jgi:hypothetical protein
VVMLPGDNKEWIRIRKQGSSSMYINVQPNGKLILVGKLNWVELGRPDYIKVEVDPVRQRIRLSRGDKSDRKVMIYNESPRIGVPVSMMMLAGRYYPYGGRHTYVHEDWRFFND